MVYFILFFLSEASIHFLFLPFLSHATPILIKLKNKISSKVLSVLFVTPGWEVTDSVLKHQRDTHICKEHNLKTCIPSLKCTFISEHGNAKPEPQTCLTNKNTFSSHVCLILFCLLYIMLKGKWIDVYAYQKISSGERLDEFWWNLVRTFYRLKPLHALIL